jgi:hypothetical protein
MLIGCVYPNQQTTTVDDRPSLFVVGAPGDAILYIDRIEMGPSGKFDGQPNVLVLEPGTHHVEIRQGTRVLHTENVFLGEGTRRAIKVSGGEPSP